MFDNKLDTLIIFEESNRLYYTHFESSFGCAIVTPTTKLFVTDFRYESEARQAIDFEVIACQSDNFYEVVARECKRLKSKNIGFEDNYLSVAEFKELKTYFGDFTLKPVGKLILEQRAVKTEQEIAIIGEAQSIAQNALKKIIPYLKTGVTERDLEAELVYEMMKAGAEKPSFDTIVAFGENTANPHHKCSNYKLDKNDLILIDMGVKHKGYCSDMTRTFTFGTPFDQLCAMHGIVLEAQKYALKHIRSGMTGHEADSLAREYIKANGYSSEFGHSLGHGVGADIHEYPRLGLNSVDILKENMVVSVEPGIYIRGLGGIRIEDLVVIKNDGVVNLTNFDKNLYI